jgi:hypothetical protein
MADGLTIVLNGVTANDSGFTKIGSIKSMDGMINGQKVEISESAEGKGIDKEALNNALNAGNSTVPVTDVDEAEALRIKTEKDAEAIRIQNKTDVAAEAEALRIKTEKDAALKKEEEKKDEAPTNNDLTMDQGANFKAMVAADQYENRGGRRKSRKAKRTKKGGKKRRNTLRRHR